MMDNYDSSGNQELQRVCNFLLFQQTCYIQASQEICIHALHGYGHVYRKYDMYTHSWSTDVNVSAYRNIFMSSCEVIVKTLRPYENQNKS